MDSDVSELIMNMLERVYDMNGRSFDAEVVDGHVKHLNLDCEADMLSAMCLIADEHVLGDKTIRDS